MNSQPSHAGPDPDRIAEWLRGGGLENGRLVSQSNQGVVVRTECDGTALAVKSPVGNPLVWRLRQMSLVRESRAYERLAGVPGVPRCHGLVDRRWLVLEFIDGRPFRDARPAEREAFFDALLATIRAMHTRGVAHGDLKRKSNLMVDAGGRPVILDLGAAVVRRPGRHPLNRRLFEFLRQTDLNAWVKLKYGGYDGVSEADRPLLRRSRLERLLGHLRRS